MQLWAVFESWHIPDGNYPPLSRDELVRLSFELEPKMLAKCDASYEPRLEHLGNAEYRGVGRVLRRYPGELQPLIVLDTGEFRFYIYSADAAPFEVGDRIEFSGTLLLDHYIWVEYLSSYPDPPDLFYNLRVARIRRVAVPERFISRHDRGKALPTRVGPGDFGDGQELDTMNDQDLDEAFLILQFDDAGVAGTNVRRTFR